MDLTTSLSVVAIGLAGLTLLARLIDKSLSIREHEEHRKSVERDLSRIESSLRIIDASKPTTGELDANIRALKDRLEVLENKQKPRS